VSDTSIPDTTQPTSPLEPLIELLRERLMPPSETIDRPGFATMLLLGLTAFDQLRATGKVGPKPFRVGGQNTIRWDRAEVIAWIRNRDASGELYDSESWPAVWTALQNRRVK
jgi:predicted DNA-binding transcriptional regulator AlpA